MILSYSIRKKVHALVRLSVFAGKILFGASREKPMLNKILNHYTNMTIIMELSIHVSHTI